MNQIIVHIIPESGAFAAYSDNCPEIYASGLGVEDAKKNILEVIEILREEMSEPHLPVPIRDRWPVMWSVDPSCLNP